MAREDNKLLALLGWNCTGDVGPWTFYTSERHQLVWFPRVPALNPPNAAQLAQRQKWTAAAATWQALTANQRNTYELACRKLSLKLTGYNLWLYKKTTGDTATIATIARQSGLTLAP